MGHGHTHAPLMDKRHPVVRYAEDQLGINHDFAHAQEVQSELAALTEQVETLEMKIRNTGDLADLRKNQIIVGVTESSESDASGAAVDRAIKLEVAKDETLVRYTTEIMGWREELASARARRSSLVLFHTTLLSRMNQSAGVLNALAATKNAEVAAASNIWPF